MNLSIPPVARARLAPLIEAAKHGLEALESMRQRDRLALSAAALALLVGLDLLVVAPLHDKRLAIELAKASSARDDAAALASRDAERNAFEADLLTRQTKVAKALAGYGAAGNRVDSLHFLLSRTLQGLPVSVLSLRSQGVDEVEVAAVDPEAAAAALAGPVASAPTASAPTPSKLYRHRYELRVGGTLPALLKSIEALEHNSRPLRIERVRLLADAGGALEASVVLMTLGPDRTWLSL